MKSRVVLPYSNDMARFAAPSSAAHDGVQRQVGDRARHHVTTDTGEIFWGEPGTNGQQRAPISCCTRAPGLSTSSDSHGPPMTSSTPTPGRCTTY